MGVEETITFFTTMLMVIMCALEKMVLDRHNNYMDDCMNNNGVIMEPNSFGGHGKKWHKAFLMLEMST